MKFISHCIGFSVLLIIFSVLTLGIADAIHERLESYASANVPKPGGLEKIKCTTLYILKSSTMSLWQLAQAELGDANKWRLIVELNKDRFPSLETNPDYVQQGWELVLPSAGCAGDRLE